MKYPHKPGKTRNPAPAQKNGASKATSTGEPATGLPQLVLERTAYLTDQLPEVAGPHVILAGRSNVGKSSLVNRLAGRKGLAKVSAQPGKTRSVNFYRVQPQGFHLVDLPGYGYARRSKTERAAWAALTRKFVTQSPPAAVAGIVDCRVEPQASDLEMVAWARELGRPLILILTKVDKVSQSERATRAAQWKALSGVAPIPFSAKTGFGLNALWAALCAATAGAMPEEAEDGESVPGQPAPQADQAAGGDPAKPQQRQPSEEDVGEPRGLDGGSDALLPGADGQGEDHVI